MHKTFVDSRIEIWSASYINNDDEGRRRHERDKDAVIIQIERGTDNDNYIVEVLDKMDDAHMARFL